MERSGSLQWPENVLAYLEKKFWLLPRDMVALRCVRRRGSFGGLPANFIRICDQAMACEQGIIIKGYRDLDKHPDLVLFEGHIFQDGTVHLRRRKSTVPSSVTGDKDR